MIDRILDRNLFYEEFKKLKKKAHENHSLLDKAEVNKTVTLGWVLNNQDFVIDDIIKTINDRTYTSPIAIEKKVMVKTKERILYGFDWHEKILQGVIANVLTEQLEPVFSNSLNSYRKGRGPFNTLIHLCEFLSSIKDRERLFIIKKDIKSYGDNIDHDILFKILSKYVPENDYLYDVLNKIIRFKYKETGSGDLKEKKRGMPTGSQINNVMVNLFLSDMDNEMDKISGNDLCYFRYGDDVFIATEKKELAEKANNILNSFVKERNLQFNKEKELNTLINDLISRVNKFKYLGLVVSVKGQISLSEDKELLIKDEIEGNLRKVLIMLRNLKLSKHEKIEALIKVTRASISKTNLFSNLSSYFLVVNDDDYWKKLDLWIAKTILKVVYKRDTGKNFDRCSYDELRKLKLPSIRHARRLYLRDRSQFKEYLN